MEKYTKNSCYTVGFLLKLEPGRVEKKPSNSITGEAVSTLLSESQFVLPSRTASEDLKINFPRSSFAASEGDFLTIPHHSSSFMFILLDGKSKQISYLLLSLFIIIFLSLYRKASNTKINDTSSVNHETTVDGFQLPHWNGLRINLHKGSVPGTCSRFP